MFEYVPARINFTHAQLAKVKKGLPIRLTHGQIGVGDKVVLLHPIQHAQISKAHHKGKGAMLHLSHGEIGESHHSTLEGTGFWGDIWSGIKKVWGVLKDTGAASKLADMGATALSGVAPEFAPAIAVGRQVLKSTSGVGIQQKGRRRVNGNGLYL